MAQIVRFREADAPPAKRWPLARVFSWLLLFAAFGGVLLAAR